MKNISRAVMATFRDGLRMVDDRHLSELRARFIALDATAMTIPTIDLEIAERKHRYFAQSRNLHGNLPATLACASVARSVAIELAAVQ